VAAPLLLKDGVLNGISRFEVGRGDGGSGSAPIGGQPERREGLDAAHLGLWLFLGTVSMLFIGFTSAFVVRRASADWVPVHAPAILWLNTGVLLLSSGALENARRALRARRHASLSAWITLTGGLGLLFVVGQLGAWTTLAAQGLYLSSNPWNSFFYLLTGVHVVHVAAALLWYTAVFVRIQRRRYEPGRDALSLFATFWHFLAGVWVYLLFVLFVL
jgi:cytochrome c oxidase subunit III